jgi:predicted nucleotidyltransferase
MLSYTAATSKEIAAILLFGKANLCYHPTQVTVIAKRKSTSNRWMLPAIVPTGSDKPVTETLPRVVKRIARTLKPQKIILFGSYAYGIPTSDSDVDLLVIMDTDERSPIKRVIPVMRLIVPRPFDIDVLVRTPAEVEALRESGSLFIKEILATGKSLYERRNYAPATVQ